MSFLQIKKNSIYLQVSSNPKLIRPLFKEAEGRWVWNIPSCTKATPQGKKEYIRFYRQVDAEFSQWMKNNPDPLWEMLEPMDKFDRQGNRTDFSIRPVHVLPVWDHEEQDVKIVKQGNQFFEELIKWYDQGGDVTGCDWMAYTEGAGRTVSYKTVRQDQSAFNHPDIATIQIKAKEMLAQVFSDLTPFKTEDELVAFIYGVKKDQNEALPAGNMQPPQAQIPQASMPTYTPGGDTGVALGSMPPPQPAPTMQQPTMPQPAMPQPAPAMPQPAPAMPQPAMPQPAPAMQQPAMPQPAPAMQQPTMPQPTMQQPTMPQPTMPQPAMQQPTMPQPTMPQPTMPQPAMPGYVPQGPQATQGFMPSAPSVQAGIPQAPAPSSQEEVANAPVQAAPVFAPPIQSAAPTMQSPAPSAAPAQAQDSPANTIVDSGKYSGKTLGWILENERSYLTFLKGHKKHLTSAIEQLLGGNVAVDQAAPAQVPPAAAAAAHAAAGGNTNESAERTSIIDQINKKVLDIPDFQGPGIAQNMMPFLEQTIGTTAFSDAPLQDLIKLNQAIDAKMNMQ